jgi:hypothetical protein
MEMVAGHWWLTPVILATQEVEIRRIMVRSQPQASSLQDPSQKKRAGRVAQGVGPEFKPQYHKKKKKWKWSCFLSGYSQPLIDA